MTAPVTPETVRSALSTIASVCRGRSKPDLSLVQPFVEPIITYIQRGVDEYRETAPPPAIYDDAVAALREIIEQRPASEVQSLYHKVIVQTLLTLIPHQPRNGTMIRNVVSIVGTFVCQDVEAAIPDLRDSNFFGNLEWLLEHDSVCSMCCMFLWVWNASCDPFLLLYVCLFVSFGL